MNHYGIPGIGGSLGKCAVCGECFAFEVLTGETIESFNMPQFSQTLYAHHHCAETLEKLRGGDWHELPDGPIKEAFQKLASAQES